MPSRSAYTLGEQPCSDFRPTEGYYGHNEHECFGGPERRECGGRVSFCENCHRDHHAFGYERCGTDAANGWDQYRFALAAETSQPGGAE